MLSFGLQGGFKVIYFWAGTVKISPWVKKIEDKNGNHENIKHIKNSFHLFLKLSRLALSMINVFIYIFIPKNE